MSEPIVEALLGRLNTIRDRYGDDAFKRAAEQAAKEIFRSESPEVKRIVQESLKDYVDFEKVERELHTAPSVKEGAAVFSQLMAQQLRQQMPGLQTQAQFDAFMTAFDAFRAYMNHTFLGEKDLAAKYREALLRGLDLAVEVTELSEQLGHVPEAATSPEAEKFKQPPKEFGELEVQQGLLAELAAMDSKLRLQQWYEANKSRLAKVVSPNLRNPLYDAIRAKNASFLS